MLFEIVLGVLGAMVVVMVAAWGVVLVAKDGGWTDVFWTWGTTITIAAAALHTWTGPSPRQWLVAGLMVIWGLRLGLYLTPRVATQPEDARYAGFRAQWGKRYPLNMLFVTLPQAPATALLSLSAILAAQAPGRWACATIWPSPCSRPPSSASTSSDAQMKRFRGDPANRGR